MKSFTTPNVLIHSTFVLSIFFLCLSTFRFAPLTLSEDGKIVIEVEAGRAVFNNQFLKDIFQACMMFEVEYLVIAVLNEYHFKVNGSERVSHDYDSIRTFLETLYVSNRLQLPLKGILLIGY